MTHTLADEFGPHGIRVNCLAPGGVETEGTRANGVVGGEAERRIIAATPLGRFGQPTDIGKVAVFLASDAAGWMTRERIVVSGGFSVAMLSRDTRQTCRLFHKVIDQAANDHPDL